MLSVLGAGQTIWQSEFIRGPFHGCIKCSIIRRWDIGFKLDKGISMILNDEIVGYTYFLNEVQT